MADPRVNLALRRIEAAVDRIEARIAQPAPAAGDPGLAARHDRLRHDTAAALARLDRLLDPGEESGSGQTEGAV